MNPNTGRYRIDKFSITLSEVQTGNSNQYKTWKYNYRFLFVTCGADQQISVKKSA